VRHFLPVSSSQIGISYSTRSEAEKIYYSSIFSFVGNLQGFHEEIEQINKSTLPVIFTGEDGTGKEAIANMVYSKSPFKAAH